MDWKQIINFNQFKRFTKQNINEKYILITHREINIKLKRLSKIHCLYTKNEKYLLPEKVYKNGNFNSNIIYNYLQFNDTLYRICSRGNFSIYTDKYININNIKDKQLSSICRHYYNCNQAFQDMLLYIACENDTEELVNIYLIYDNFNINLAYSHQLPSFNFNQIILNYNLIMRQKTAINIYIIYLYAEYLIIYYIDGVFKIKFNNNFYVNNDINVLAKFIYERINIKIDITLEYIKKIFHTIKSNELLKTL